MEKHVEIDDFNSNPGDEEKKAKTLVVILVGAPGSGKSTFCDHVIRASPRSWARICQDNINNGKSGTKIQCLSSAAAALKERKNIFIDRCNLDREQRADFVKLGSPEVDVHAVVLDLPAKLCISRSVKRSGHEGNLQGGKAAAVVNRMLQKKELPKLSEGYFRITICQSENDVEEAVKTYSKLRSLDTLPQGFFGQKSPDAKVQVGIMKFLKKVDQPANVGSGLRESSSSLSSQSVKEAQGSSEAPKPNSIGGAGENLKEEDRMEVESVPNATASMNVPDHTASLGTTFTLAFPSISTQDFKFDMEKASDIIVEKVQEFENKLGDARLVLVDLNPRSRILSLVKAKAAEQKIDPKKFFTFVGDITYLYSKGGLACNVIANATNWRLRPGGGGVNAAIYSAAGPSLEIATKERVKSLAPGKAVVIPLSSVSPLYKREGVTHVIHVLGPNMNPQRPNCLKNNYDEGCKVLQEAYSSLFTCFATIIKTQTIAREGDNVKSHMKQSELESHNTGGQETDKVSNENMGRGDVDGEQISKKHKGLNYEVGRDKVGLKNGTQQQDKLKNVGATKAWGSFALALFKIAMNPEKHEKEVLEVTTDVVVINDAYPKAKRHILVIARLEGLDCLGDVCQDHLPLLKTMQRMGLKWVEKFLEDDESLIFRLGFHSVPSLRQLHLHVISQDFDSQCLKNKKHWNSFNTEFFRDVVDVIEEVQNSGKASMKDESLLSKELRCHRCRSAHPNIPRLKSHIGQCQVAFPSELLREGRLIQAPSISSSSA